MNLVKGTKITFDNNVTYEVLLPIGAGGQGSVYKVKNLSDKKEYALKVLVDKDKDRKDMKDRNIHLLIKENADAEAAKTGNLYKINHTFPITSCTYQGETLYVMELANGKTLDYMIDEDNGIIQKMSVENKLRLAKQIAQSIQIINKAIGGCYTDINWGNFIVDSATGCLYVVDCENVASNTDIQNGKFSFVLGTAFFMAPEVAFELANAGMNADRYALANLIFRILTNNKIPSPYHGKVMYASPACQNMLEVKDLFDEDDIDEAWSVFIFDENDQRNGIREIYRDADASKPKLQKKRRDLDEVIAIWDSLDDRLKALFAKAFKDPLNEAEYTTRPSPLDWVNTIDAVLNGTPTVKTHAANSGADVDAVSDSATLIETDTIEDVSRVGLSEYEDFVPNGTRQQGASALSQFEDFVPGGSNNGVSEIDTFEDFVPAGSGKTKKHK